MSSLFNDCRLVEFLDLSNWNTSKVTVMSLLFGANDNVDIPMKLSIIKGIESLDLSSAKDINRMFYNCRNIKNLDLSNWNIENVTTIEMMFYLCTSLENVNVSNWNTKIVEKMNKLFYQCYSLKSINLSGWKFDSISSIEQMFQDNNNLNDITINTASYNILIDQIPDRTSSEPGIITMVGDKTGIDTSVLNSKNWNVV
jgi:surface protein